MANPYSSVVGRKLAYAKALLRLEAGGQGSPVVQAALSQGALMHLHGAWLAFVREIAANYQLGDPGQIASASALCEALKAVGKTPSEATELLDLEADPASWLSQLFALYRQINDLPSVATPVAPAEGVIQVTSIDTTMVSADVATVQCLLDAFTELVDRQRETMIEC